MYLHRLYWTNKKGKTYRSIWLRESYRVGDKTYKRSYANLKDWPDEWVAKLEEYLETQKPSRKQGETNSKKKKAVQEQICRPKDIVERQGHSFGAVYVLYEIAKRLGIEKALGTTQEGKLALRKESTSVSRFWHE